MVSQLVLNLLNKYEMLQKHPVRLRTLGLSVECLPGGAIEN